jgi:hypothetical protein
MDILRLLKKLRKQEKEMLPELVGETDLSTKILGVITPI